MNQLVLVNSHVINSVLTAANLVSNRPPEIETDRAKISLKQLDDLTTRRLVHEHNQSDRVGGNSADYDFIDHR